MGRKSTKAELKGLSKNQLVRKVLQLQDQTPAWPAYPAGGDKMIVSRGEWRRFLEQQADELQEELQGVVSWMHQVDRSIAVIEKTLTSTFTAVAAGGKGTALARAIQGSDERLTQMFTRLINLVKHPPSGAEIGGTLVVHVQQLGQVITDTLPAIQACTGGGDGGAALRQLAERQGNDWLRQLIDVLYDQLANVGRNLDPALTWLADTAHEIRAAYKKKNGKTQRWADTVDELARRLENGPETAWSASAKRDVNEARESYKARRNLQDRLRKARTVRG
jgi:hypothetical protein